MAKTKPIDPDFADAPKEKLGTAIVPLAKYQKEAIANKTRIKIYKWCRQSGKDFTASLEAVLDALTSHQKWFIVSLTERQSLATFDKAKMHCRAIGVALNDIQEVEEEHRYYSDSELRWCTVKSKTIILPGGGSVTALPGADPDAIAGLTGNVIFTEFALFPNNGRDHWRVIFPLTTRGFRLIVISTPRGTGTKFAELCRNVKGNYYVSVVDIHRAIADGMSLVDEEGKPITAEELEELYDDSSGWKREYLCQESDDLDALIAWRYLELAKADYEIVFKMISSIDDYNPNHEDVFKLLSPGSYFLGWDIARHHDLSVVWVNELVEDVFYLRVLICMHKMDFPYMRQVVWQAMRQGMCGAGDATGMGMESMELTAQEFPGMFSEINFNTSKGAIGSTLMTTFQDVRQRIPRKNSGIIAQDLHAIEQDKSGGKLVLHETQNPLEKRSHCDIAYACGLSLFAAKDYDGFVGVSVL